MFRNLPTPHSERQAAPLDGSRTVATILSPAESVRSLVHGAGPR
jgi:hypothetical protein